MNSGLSRQRGMTLIGYLLSFVLFGFLVLLVLKLTPIYLEHFKVKASLESLKSDTGLSSKTRDEIIGMLIRRWDVNSIDRVNGQDIVVKRESGRVKVQVAYEVVEPIMGNVSALVTFDDSIEVGSGQ